MEWFTFGDRVKVIRYDGMEARRAVLVGQTGTVARIRMRDGGAWVDMHDDLPDGLRSFPAGDPRQNHILLYPEECEALEKKP